MPNWAGIDDYEGDIIHPQRWPEGYDYTDKRIVVIGSGTTAATLIPALSDRAGHIVQLQRSPSYYLSLPNEHPLATQLRQLKIPKEWIHEILRQQRLKDHDAWVRHALDNPERATMELLEGVRNALGGELPDEFIPRYKPWHQRVCMIPDGDFFKAINSGKASVVTDEIARFTKDGILLKSGDFLEADLVITATGFNINSFGDIDIVKDDSAFDISQTVTYRGMMFTDVPNFAWVVGYFRSAPYTARAELVGEIVCKLLNFMHAKDFKSVTAQLRSQDQGMRLGSVLDTKDWISGYVMREAKNLPKSGDQDPWRHTQDYFADRADFDAIDFGSEALVFK